MYLVDPKQSNNIAKIEKLRLNSVREKANDSFFIVKLGHMSVISLDYAHKLKKKKKK